MANRNFTEIVNDLITYILRQNQKIDIAPGQVIRDVSINAPASIMEDLYNNIEQIRTAQSILNANLMTTQDMDNLAANYGITRKAATQSQGTVTFYTPTQPVSDFQIPAGTRVATSPSNNNPQTVFQTINAAQFLTAFESTYYNPDTGNWEIQINVQAEQGGTRGNVGPFTITTALNFDLPFKVTNRIACTGGTDQESNQDLATRTINSFTGNNKGTKNGYLGTITSQPNVLDALVVGPGDDLMYRDGGLGGKVDIWTLTSNLGSTELNKDNTPSLTFAWDSQQQASLGYVFNFPNLPVDVNSPLTVVGTTSPTNPLNGVVLYEESNPAPAGIAYIDEGEYHYTFNKANNLDTANSVDATDNIVWNPITLEKLRQYPNGTNPSNSLQIDITYSYDKTINDLQTLIDDPNNKIITADVLVKAALEITIDVEVSVNLEPSYKETQNTESQTINNIIQAITNAVDTTQMGTKLEKSDLVQVIHEVPGVDNVVLNSIILTQRMNSVYGIPPLVIENTEANANEYLSAGNISVTSI